MRSMVEGATRPAQIPAPPPPYGRFPSPAQRGRMTMHCIVEGCPAQGYPPLPRAAQEDDAILTLGDERTYVRTTAISGGSRTTARDVRGPNPR